MDMSWLRRKRTTEQRGMVSKPDASQAEVDALKRLQSAENRLIWKFPFGCSCDPALRADGVR
jgi:hypothetical protein